MGGNLACLKLIHLAGLLRGLALTLWFRGAEQGYSAAVLKWFQVAHGPAAHRPRARQRRAALEEVVGDHNGVGEVELAVVVRVGGIVAAGARASEKEVVSFAQRRRTGTCTMRWKQTGMRRISLSSGFDSFPLSFKQHILVTHDSLVSE